jgi:TonB family protein
MRTPPALWTYAGLLALLAGCTVVQPARVADSVRLKDNAGIILYRVNCGPGVAWAEFYRSGTKAAGYLASFQRAGALLCTDGVQSKQLTAGTYFIGKIGYETWIEFEEAKAMQFTVTPGKINYIGHIRVPSSKETRDGRNLVLISDPTVADRSEEARNWLTANQPSLQQNYPLVEALAVPVVRAPHGREAGSSSTGTTELRVILELLVAADGSIKDGRIAQSSGHPSVDEAALREAMRAWKVTPHLEAGQAVEKWMNFAVTFRLTD